MSAAGRTRAAAFCGDNHGDPSAVSGSGNPCVGPHGNFPCVAGATGWGSYTYTVEHYTNSAGRSVVDWWLITAPEREVVRLRS